MKEIKIQIPENVVNDIQLKDFEAISMQMVITNMLEAHALDDDTRIIDSPVFKGYQNRLAQVHKEFEQAKNNMLSSYVDKEIHQNTFNWTLDYNSCTLTLIMKE